MIIIHRRNKGMMNLIKIIRFTIKNLCIARRTNQYQNKRQAISKVNKNVQDYVKRRALSRLNRTIGCTESTIISYAYPINIIKIFERY